MPDPLDMIDQIAQRQPAQQTRTRRRRNPRIRETQPEAERTDREDVQSAVGESLAGALPQLESAFDTIDRPDPIDSEDDGWQMMSADDAFAPRQQPQVQQAEAPEPTQLGRGESPIEPDADEVGGPIDGDADDPAWEMMSVDEALGPRDGAWDLMSADDAFSYGNPPPGMMAEAPEPEPEPEQPAQAPEAGPVPVDEEESDVVADEPPIDDEPAIPEPQRGYTTDELLAMQRGERRDRIMSGIQGGTQALGGILQAIGGGVGNMGLASAGGGMAQGASELPEPDAYETAKTSADERIARDDEFASQTRRDALEAERMRVWEETQREAQDSRRAFGDLQAQQLQARIESDRAAGDPSSQASRAARATFLATLGGAPPSVQERFRSLDLESMDARSIGEAMSALETAIDDERANNPRGRGGGGGAPRMPAAVPGGGTPRPRPVTGDVPANEPSVLERRIRAYAEARGLNPDEEIQYYDSLSGRDQRSYRQLVDRTLGRGGSGGDDDTGLPENIEPRTLERFATRYAPAFGRSRSIAGLHVALARANDAQIRAALSSRDGPAVFVNGVDLRSRVWTYLNQYFHEFGGANIVDSEMSRYMSAFGAGSIGAPPAAFKSSIQRALNESRAQEDDIAGGFAPQYRSFWMENRRRRN